MTGRYLERVLHDIVTQYGAPICDDSRRCKALLNDLCPSRQKEINLLVVALEERIASDLQASRGGLPRKALLAKLVARLEENRGLSTGAARWAVSTWALALGVITPQEHAEALSQSSTSTVHGPSRGRKHRPVRRLSLAVLSLALIAAGLLAGSLASLTMLPDGVVIHAAPNTHTMRTPQPFHAVLAVVRKKRDSSLPWAHSYLSPLSFGVAAFPSGATISHQHIDASAKAVDSEHIFGGQDREGDHYQRLHFGGTLFESVRLPSFKGSRREVAFVMTLFPSQAAARAAMSMDMAVKGCRASPAVTIPMRVRTCAFQNRSTSISCFYIFGAAGNAELVAVGDVLAASPMALRQAELDTTSLAMHVASRVDNHLAAMRGCLIMRRQVPSCRTASVSHQLLSAARASVKAAPASLSLGRISVALLDAATHKPVRATTAGRAVVFRIRWTIPRLSGAIRETIRWEVAGRGRIILLDSANDLASKGRSSWDDTITVDNSWTRRSQYTAIGVVSANGHSISARLPFSVRR